MTESHVIIGLLALVVVTLAVLTAEIVRLNNTLGPIADSTLVRTATSF